MKTIVITIDTTGQVEIESQGIKGPSCKQATAALERSLGATTKDVSTGEYYERPTQLRQST